MTKYKNSNTTSSEQEIREQLDLFHYNNMEVSEGLAIDKKPLTYISLFSGAGIGCYGFKEQGFHCIATNEFLPKRLKIQKYNDKCLYHTGYIGGDITRESVSQNLYDEIERWKLNHKIDSVDVLIATPPCQGMSVANHKKKNEQKRNSLVVESIRVALDIKPKFIIFENVRRFLKTTCLDMDGRTKTIEDAINMNLGGYYNVFYEVINLKHYGSQSSRTRTLVLCVNKELENITPFDIFPEKKKAQTLRQLFCGLEPLKSMGEISSQDFYHSFRKYDARMLPWIELLEEGQSACDNEDVNRIPHRYIDGEKVYNQSKNGDKYSRWYWDREGPCIHTRNDILASQNTIHPSENRVFSIREIMLMMSVPESFKWLPYDIGELNQLSLLEKQHLLFKEELNIRHCLGEAVPTAVMNNIAGRIKNVLSRNVLSKNQIADVIDKKNLKVTSNLLKYLYKNSSDIGILNAINLAEMANSERQNTAAFFTRQDIVYTIIKNLPSFKNKSSLRILEPSVGVGSFLPQLINKYRNINQVNIDIFDVDKNSLDICDFIISKLNIPPNIKINKFNADFLLSDTDNDYDLIVGNPPFKVLTKQDTALSKYKENVINKDTNNIFSFFVEKCLKIGQHVSLIAPKSLINAPELNKSRELLESHNLVKICDYGEKAFKGVLIETIRLNCLMNRNHISKLQTESDTQLFDGII